MAVTGSEIVNVHARRLLGASDFSARLLEYLETAILRHTKVRTTGPAPTSTPDRGGWFTTITVTDGTGSNRLDFSGGDGGLYGTDGTGELISVENGDERLDEVPFQDTAATTYYMAGKTCDVPSGISYDTLTGAVHYDRHRKELGHLAEPTAVVAAGAGIQFTLGNHALHGSDDFTGRTAFVYLKNPLSNSPSVAIEEVTIVGTTATTAGALGQSVVSTDPTDYEVVLVGPTITRSNTVQSAAGWAFIGTVVGGGAPRTFSFTNQPQLVSLEDLSIIADRHNGKKGWLGTMPTVTATVGTGTMTVTTTGELMVNGRVRSTATQGAIGTLGVSADVWLYWDDGTRAFAITNSWDSANSANRVPLMWAKTDGASNILIAVKIGRLVEEFPEVMTITVADDTALRADFTDLQAALFAARSYQKGSTLKPRSIEIEIIGDITVTAPLTDARLWELEAVTIRGRAQRIGGGGGRIVWSYTSGDGLFVPSSGTMRGWTFEDIVFRAGVLTSTKAAIVSGQGTAVISGLTFRRCTIDGNDLLSLAGVGGGNGSLAHAVYFESSGSLSGLTFVDCLVATTDTFIFNTAVAGDGIGTLLVRDCTYAASGTQRGGTEGGIVDTCTASGGPGDWRISGNSISARSQAIRTQELARAWIYDNTLENSINDAIVVDIGSNYSASDIYLHDNRIRQLYAAGAGTQPVVRIRGGMSPEPAGIFVHDNHIEGDSATSTAVGIEIGANTFNLRGVIIHSNVFNKVSKGLRLVSAGAGLIRTIASGNYVSAGDVGFEVGAGAEDPVLTGNYAEILNASGIGFDLNATAVLAGNMVAADSSTVVAVDIDADEVVMAGNRFDERVSVTGTRVIMAGNSLGENLEFVTSGGASILAGNLVFGTTNYATGSDHLAAGNRYFGAVTMPPSTTGDHGFVGNRFDDTTGMVLSWDRGSFVANVVDATSFSLDASSSKIAACGNYIADATVTDAGSGNDLTGLNTN